MFVRGYGRDGRKANFQAEMLPQLASHYRREALKELEEKCPWLKPFRSAQPALNDARDHFFRDGSDCINNIEKHTELVWLAAVNDALTAKLGLPYTVFLAEFYKGIDNATIMEIGEAYRSQSNYIAEHEWMRDRIKEQIGLDSLVQSFVEAEETMRVENRARAVANKSDNDLYGVSNLVHFLMSSQVALLRKKCVDCLGESAGACQISQRTGPQSNHRPGVGIYRNHLQIFRTQMFRIFSIGHLWY